MAYQSLYRRYRPQTFAEVRGQDHLVRALRNAVVDGRVGHAYLFSGPRGTGKTSTARILAKVLNCEHVVDGEPCGTCASCVAIETGSSFDVHELDAASNNGVEAIRDLINKAALGSPGRTKVYILDEVHMLTAGASNALLKTLEEPPDHVVFVLATTDPQKVLPTIKSRTQHFEVHLLPASDLESLVDDIAKDAGLDVSPEARDYVLRVGGGSARDTLSALDQVVAAGGIPHDASALDELVEALCDHDTGRALIAVEEAINSGRGPRGLGEDLIGRLRDVFLATMKADLTRLPDSDRERVAAHAARLGAAGATRALEVLGTAFVGIADAPDPRIPLEVALVRLTKPEVDHSLEAIVERLERLERGLGPLGAPPPAAPHTPTHAHVDPVVPAAPTPAAPAAPVTPSTVADQVEAPPAEDDDDGAPFVPASGRPADLARQQLAARGLASGGAAKPAPRPTAPPAAPSSAPGADLPGRAPGPRRTPAPTAPAAAAAPPSEPAAPVARAATAPASAGAGTGSFPTLEGLEQAWNASILSSLTGGAKPRFAAARFLEVENGVAVLGVPNAIHAAKCEERRRIVEVALAEHFGQPIGLRIVVDGDAVAPRSASEPPPRDETPDDYGADVDLSQLTDAEDTAVSGIDRIAEAFPGVEVIETE